MPITFGKTYRSRKLTEYPTFAGRLAKKGLISEIEADSIRPDIQVTGDALNSLVGETPESSSPTAEEQ